ncbi:MAG: trimethyllysine dioxygenase [Kiloniellales bacterium]|nr:trimethyllysine dioxygenase [Kiloniellales bacterium]
MPPKIESAAISPRGLAVTWADGARADFPMIWLRDHCRAPESYDATTNQRRVDTFAIPDDLAAETVELRDSGAALEVAWRQEDLNSRYDSAFLRAQAFGEAVLPERRLWAEGPPAPARHGFSGILGDDAALRRLLSDFWRDGLVLVEGLPSELAATRRLAERIAYVRETIFGGVWDFQADGARADSAYSNEAVGLHTDGTYSEDPPGLQCLHCLAFDGEGAVNVFADGFRVAERLRAEAPEAFRLLSELEVPGEYLGDGVHLLARHPVLGLDAAGALRRVCFNNFDRAPFRPQPAVTEAFYAALRRFHALLSEEAYHLRLQLRPGLAVLFDNWRILHARTGFTGHRHMAGFYLNREDLESRLRLPPG